eukprot:m.109431 g.109431  ORF g.109431 m.109431 type:complete len:909 (-) comp27957_c0_seq1:190-2916(-)
MSTTSTNSLTTEIDIECIDATNTSDDVAAEVISPSPSQEGVAKNDINAIELGVGLSELNGASPVVVPEDLIADFDLIVSAFEVDTNGDGVVDHIRLGDPENHTEQSTLIPIDEWANGNFNLLDQSIRRDGTHQVTTNEELIAAFNNHSFSGSLLGKISGVAVTIVSFGTYVLARRRVVPPGYFGHYISTERHKLVAAGVQSLGSTTSKWCPNMLIDDETNPNRKFGDKVILQVPENHLAGGYRIGTHGTGSSDQEFVLFSQGRHVLPESKYYGVTIVKLDKSQLTLGPLTVLYVREGWLGGCVRRKTGTYRILYPGPPYILHEAEFESIKLVKRSDDIFALGPYEFVCVKSGQLAGAYRKADGIFQILPPGHSYKLHSKDFQPVETVVRKIQFKLGPYYYLTVKDNFVAGVFIRQTGLFRRLAPGKTYRLNRDTFMEPVQQCRDAHITKCGPLTVLTVEQGTLNGAFRVEDGVFVEFEDMDTEYILHEKQYYGLTTVPKYSAQLQTFGPYKVITIREGYVGQFECEGKIEIKQPGFYKVNSAYNIYESIPVKMFQETLAELNFRAKDGVQMSAKASVTWNVSDPMLVAKFAGSFAELHELVVTRSRDVVVRLCKMRNRGDLLPTKQDIELNTGTEQFTPKQLSDMTDERAFTLVTAMVESCKANLNEISETSKLGITCVKVQIDRFTLKNVQILQDLEDITKAELAAKAEKVRGQLEVARAEATRLTRMKTAEADAAVRRTMVATECESRVKENEADNVIQASIEAMTVKVATDKTVQEAEAKAKAIHAITEAEYNKAIKERQAAGAMAPCELELKRLELQVNMLKEIGQAAWKYPDVYSGFLDQFGSSLRFGPMTAQETLSKALLTNTNMNTSNINPTFTSNGKVLNPSSSKLGAASNIKKAASIGV